MTCFRPNFGQAYFAAAMLVAALLSIIDSFATTHEVGPGESLYGIVAIHYPQDMNNWTGIAAQLVELNPDVLTQGMDTALQPGMVLRLLDEVDNSAPPPVFSSSSNESAHTTSGQSSNQAVEQAAGQTRNQSSTTATNRPSSSSSGNNSSQRDTTALSNQTTDANNQAATSPANPSSQAELSGAKYPIGIITALSGSVTLQRQNASLQLSIGDKVIAGDELRTANRTTLTLDMMDQTIYQLGANTVISLEDYAFEANNGKGHAIITLVRGVLQVQSGQLATNGGNQLSVNTVIATITIKGTEFALAMCSASNCDRNGLDINAGLYSGVVDGTITLQNNTGSRDSGAGEFLHIASVNSEAEVAPHVAPLLFTAEQLERLHATHRDEPLGFLGWLLSLFGSD